MHNLNGDCPSDFHDSTWIFFRSFVFKLVDVPRYGDHHIGIYARLMLTSALLTFLPKR
jgi:hypothetical protein